MDAILELERKVELLSTRIQQLEADKAKAEWISLAEFCREVGGVVSADQVRKLVTASIRRPADSPMQNGRHFFATSGERGLGNIKINRALFRQAMGMV